jgi:AcrR family transcriptional regulator
MRAWWGQGKLVSAPRPTCQETLSRLDNRGVAGYFLTDWSVSILHEEMSRMTKAARRGRPADERSRAERREQILDAAARAFAKEGYPNTEVQDVADAVGVGKGTIYLYFSSKEELFLAAADRGMHRLKAFVEERCEGAEDGLERTARAITAYLTFFKDHPEHAELLIQERAEFRDRRKPTYFEHLDRGEGHRAWEELYRGLIAAGRVRDVPISRIMDVLSDLVYGTMFTNHFSGRHKPVEVQAEDILDVVFNGILTGPERRRPGPPNG